MSETEASDEPAPADGSDHRRAVRRALEWTGVVVGALVIAYVIQLTSLQAFSIPSESMLPTLATGDRVLVNKWSYRVHDVHRGDVVVFTRPVEVTDTKAHDLIKRVIGLPGEAITFDGGHVLVDGQVLAEPYLPAGVVTLSIGPVACPPSDPCLVPDGELWVMGDNRMHSEDSRWFGSIPQSTVVGRAFAVIWPLRRVGSL